MTDRPIRVSHYIQPPFASCSHASCLHVFYRLKLCKFWRRQVAGGSDHLTGSQTPPLPLVVSSLHRTQSGKSVPQRRYALLGQFSCLIQWYWRFYFSPIVETFPSQSTDPLNDGTLVHFRKRLSIKYLIVVFFCSGRSSTNSRGNNKRKRRNPDRNFNYLVIPALRCTYFLHTINGLADRNDFPSRNF